MTKLQSNINVQELIQESANKSYNLALEICEGGVENNITRHGMTELASEWYKAKKHFIEMFGGKTSVEIVVEGEFEERVGKEMLYEYMERMLIGNFVYKREKYNLQQLKIEELNSYATYCLKQFMVSDRGVQTIGHNKITDDSLMSYYLVNVCKELGINADRLVGMKFTKFFIMMLKSFLELGKFEDDTVGKLEVEIISQDFSQLINTIKTTKKKQTVVLSCALEDFISMSYGNSWHSCHNLGSDYGQGCIAYAMSSNVLIAYVENEHEEYLKNWRQVIYCDSDTGFAIGSRQYPSISESLTKGARNLWQKTYNKFYNDKDTTDGFIFSKSSSGLAKYLDTDNDFAYVDIVKLGEHDSRIEGHVWSTYVKDNGKNVMNVCPSDIVCLDCGNLHDEQENDSVTCYECDTEKTTCECCERRVDEDNCEWVNSEHGYVCERCLREEFDYCDYCEEYHRDYDGRFVQSVDDFVCDGCLDYHFEYCEDCEEYFESDEMYSVNGGDKYVCKHCIDDYHYCDDCGEHFSNEHIVEVDNGSTTVCKDCITNGGYMTCENCQEWFTSSCMVNGDYCEDCCEDIA